MKADWEAKKLGEVIQKTETTNPGQKPDKEFIYIDVSSVDNETFSVTNTTNLKGKYAPSRARKLVKTDDIIFATVRPTLRRIAIISSEFDGQVCSTGYFVLRAKDIISYKIIFYFLQSENFNAEMQKLQKGASYPAVTDGEVRNQIISYPKSLAEQQRIVAILDEAFAAIDRAKANAETNRQNARALFESYLQSVFANPGEIWEGTELGRIAEFRNGLNFTKSSKGELIKIVGVKDFQKNYWVPFNNLESVITGGSLNQTDRLKEGDILAVRSNGNQELIGRCILAGPVPEKTSHSGFTIRIRLNSKGIYPSYLCHYLKSYEARKQLIASGTGTNIKSLNQGALSSLVIPIPSSDQQKAIVQQIEEVSTETKKLEAIYRQKLADLDELKKAILQKAFRGELTTAQPAEIA